MIEIYWDPVPHIGPIPINWYGMNFVLAFLLGAYLVWRWAPRYGIPREKIEGLITWISFGTFAGARAYFVVQNDLGSYVAEPWRILAVWEGGLAFFGGLFGATLGAFLYSKRYGLAFSRLADLFAPAVPIGAAIGRISCGLDGMDYGTPTDLPWGVVFTHPDTYAPLDGVPRHPAPFYELIGDLLIAGLLIKMRGKLPKGGLFWLYLILFATFRFFLFFVRGNVEPVALGLKNAQWTALVILVVAIATFIIRRGQHRQEAAA